MIAFATDEELARRLARVENELRHLEQLLPSLAREVEAVRRQLFADDPPTGAAA